MSQRAPSVAVSFTNLHPLKFEQHWRENIVDILSSLRRYVPKLDMDIAEAEYVELLRCEHLLKDLYPAKYIALKRQKLDKDDPNLLRYLTGVLFHIIRDAEDTTLGYKIPAALNELVSLKRSKEEFEELQITSQEQDIPPKSEKNASLNGSFAEDSVSKGNASDTHSSLDDVQPKPPRDIYERPASSLSATNKLTTYQKMTASSSQSKDTDWTMVPFDVYMNMKSTIEHQKTTIAELTSRLSCKLYENRSRSDPHTSLDYADDESIQSQLADQFADIFREEWARAFEACTRRLHWREAESIFQLLRIVRYAYDYCENASNDQLTELESVLTGPILHPKGRFEEEEIFDAIDTRQQERLSRMGIRCARQFRKQVADLSVPEVCLDFKEHIVEQVFKWRLQELPEAVVAFIDKCIEILWRMCIQEPPLVITWANDGESVNTNYYNFYSRRGNVVRQAVWPAVFLGNGGPLLQKGQVLADTFLNKS